MASKQQPKQSKSKLEILRERSVLRQAAVAFVCKSNMTQER
jgi:hypothetical protein